MKSVFLMLVVLLISKIAQAQPSQQNLQTCNKIVPALQPFIEHEVFHGNLLLAQNGKVLCQLHFGVENHEKVEPFSRHSRFPIASLSKPIVATLLLKLHEMGKVDLQAKINKYLPAFTAPWANQVTLHHLLANRSGLPNHFMLAGWKSGRYQQALPKQELLDEVAKLDLSFTPGTQYQYSNLGWLLLGEVIESITGQRLDTNLKQYIFMPLAMTQSGLVYGTENPIVPGYRWGNKGGWQRQHDLHMQVFNTSGGIYSTAQDLLLYLTALHQDTLLSKPSQARMFSVDSPYGWRNETLTLANNIEKKVHSYDGQLEGHSGFVYQVLEDNVSLILLSNNGMGFEHKKALADDVMSAFYNMPYPDRKNTPSFVLNSALLNNQWVSTVQKLQCSPIEDEQTARLVVDLAQQLDWSGNTTKAIDLYAWLESNFPQNQRLKQRLKRLCAIQNENPACQVDIKHSVGMALLPLQDKGRKAWRSDEDRPMTTHVFYPTKDTNVEAFMLGPEQTPFFHAGSVVKGAQPADGKRPLVLMSHGTGGSAPQMLWLAQALVKQGYFVAAINHHGNTAFESEKFPEGFLLWWERSRDLQAVYQHLVNDAQWGRHIDADRVAVVGFSLGGYTALSALGGITDKALFNEYCKQAKDDFSCQPQPEFTKVFEAFQAVKNTQQVQQSNARQHNNYRVPALKAAVVIAPALVHSFREDSLQNIQTPTLFIVGDKDQIAPAKANAQYAHTLLPNSQLSVLPNVHHYSFLSRCTEQGKRVLLQLCESPYGLTRKDAHQQAIEQVLSFLAERL